MFEKGTGTLVLKQISVLKGTESKVFRISVY